MNSFRARFPSMFRSALKVTSLGAITVGAICLSKGNETFYERFFMPVMRLLPPETAHGLVRMNFVRPSYQDPERLRTRLLGMTVSNPVGMAAGFDKYGKAVAGLHSIGFGFVEIGSIPPNQQLKISMPLVIRMQEDKAVVNRDGSYNSYDVIYKRLKKTRKENKNRVMLGVNLGRKKNSPDAYDDYVQGIKKFSCVADYLVINISRPNTPGMRTMPNKSTLQLILTEVRKARSSLPPEDQRPILVKIAPDLPDTDVRDIVAVLTQKEFAVDGLIVANSMINHTSTPNSSDVGQLMELSGAPLNQMTTRLIAKVYKWSEGQIPIIGVGGIFSGRDAYEKILAGASAVQLYTAFVYHGPPVVTRVKEELNQLLKRDGFQSVEEAVGKGNKKFGSDKNDLRPLK